MTGDAPLATFSAKIRLAYALSIFGSSTRDDLDTIREIRNAFAHSTRPLASDPAQTLRVLTIMLASEY
jgi:hypothetical protein